VPEATDRSGRRAVTDPLKDILQNSMDQLVVRQRIEFVLHDIAPNRA
jgi:hypothetical protein